MLQHHISGLPVVDTTGNLTGIVSEDDFIRRSEIGTQRRPGRWLDFIFRPEQSAIDYIRQHGRKISEIMASVPVTVTEDTPLPAVVDLMEKENVKRLPVLRDHKIVGMVTRANLLQAVASLARKVPDPTADDDHILHRGHSNSSQNFLLRDSQVPRDVIQNDRIINRRSSQNDRRPMYT